MLNLQAVSHIYPGGTQALNHIDLAVPTGMFGLLGPNGAGKSTLMRCIATLQTPTEGHITFDGIDVRREPERLRALLGYLPQDFGVYPRVSAEALLDHLAVLKGITGRGERRDTVAALLQQVNLWAVRKKAVAGYSGGMRQRFGIAQALIGRPRLILVDEPTAGLDPEERHRFNNLLSEIGEQVVVMLSTHIVEDVADLCEHLAIMLGGRMVRVGKPQALTQALDGRLWRRLMRKDEAARWQQDARVISTRLRGGQTLLHLLADAAPAGFEAAAPTLEDVYFAEMAAARATDGTPA